MKKLQFFIKYLDLLLRLLKHARQLWAFTRPVRHKAAQGAKAAAGHAAGFARARGQAFAQWRKARRAGATTVAWRMLEQAA